MVDSDVAWIIYSMAARLALIDVVNSQYKTLEKDSRRAIVV